MSEKKQISMREVAVRMDDVVEKIIDPKNKDYHVQVGTMLIKNFNSYLSAYRLQLEVAKLAGTQVDVPIINMD